MKDLDNIEGILGLFEKTFQLSRRDFFKTTALFVSSLLVGSTGSFTLSAVSYTHLTLPTSDLV